MEQKKDGQRLLIDVCPYGGYVISEWIPGDTASKFLSATSDLEGLYDFLTGYMAEDGKYGPV